MIEIELTILTKQCTIPITIKQGGRYCGSKCTRVIGECGRVKVFSGGNEEIRSTVKGIFTVIKRGERVQKLRYREIYMGKVSLKEENSGGMKTCNNW